MRLLILAFVLAFTTACPTHLDPVVADFIDCTKVDIGKTVPEIGMTLLGDVLQIISAGSVGWEDQIAKLAITYGNDALACAFKAAGDTLSAHPPNVEASSSPAAARAALYIANHGWKFTAKKP